MSFSNKVGKNIVKGDFTKLNKLLRNLKERMHVDVGILGSEVDPESGITLAGIGAVHEYGTDKAGRGNSVTIPERSFIKMPIEEKADDIKKDVEVNLESNLANGNVKQIYTDMGIAAEIQIQKAFDTGGFGKWDANKPSTIAAKGSSKPLVDEGNLRKAITSKVGK